MIMSFDEILKGCDLRIESININCCLTQEEENRFSTIDEWFDNKITVKHNNTEIPSDFEVIESGVITEISQIAPPGPTYEPIDYENITFEDFGINNEIPQTEEHIPIDEFKSIIPQEQENKHTEKEVVESPKKKVKFDYIDEYIQRVRNKRKQTKDIIDVISTKVNDHYDSISSYLERNKLSMCYEDISGLYSEIYENCQTSVSYIIKECNSIIFKNKEGVETIKNFRPKYRMIIDILIFTSNTKLFVSSNDNNDIILILFEGATEMFIECYNSLYGEEPLLKRYFKFIDNKIIDGVEQQNHFDDEKLNSVDAELQKQSESIFDIITSNKEIKKNKFIKVIMNEILQYDFIEVNCYITDSIEFKGKTAGGLDYRTTIPKDHLVILQCLLFSFNRKLALESGIPIISDEPLELFKEWTKSLNKK